MWRNQNFNFRPSYGMNYPSSWYSPVRKFEKDGIKRKMAFDDLDDDFLPSKMHISEEKMVSQMNGMHLSHEFTSHGNVDDDINDKMLPKLIMCEEIKNIPTTSTQILPRQILEHCRRPSNALVLWQPPSSELGRFLGSIVEQKNEDSTDDEDKIEDNPPRDVDMMEEDDDNNNNNERIIAPNSFFGRTI